MRHYLITLTAVAAILITGILSSCNCSQNCGPYNWQYQIVFKGFQRQDLDSLMIKYYKNFGNFKPVDSLKFSSVDSMVYHGEPAFVVDVSGNDSTDVRVNLPATGAVYFINQMAFVPLKCGSCPKKYDSYHLASYTLDSTTVDLASDIVLIQK